MRTYGLEKKHLDTLYKSISKVFGADIPDVYLFGSRATGRHRKYSDIDLGLKSKSQSNFGKKLDKLKSELEESDLPFKVDIVDLDNVEPTYKKNINKEKRLFWSKELKEKSSPWRMCPIGEHWVRRHPKMSNSGKVGDWDGHCRKNPSGKEILTADELELISRSEQFLNAKPKVSTKSLGFTSGNEFDSLINGWVAYWNSIFQPDTLLPPNIVKALIASESSFNSEVSAKNKLNVGDAQGLVQMTEQTVKILKDRKGELRNHYVQLTKKDIWDPNKNIAAAVRWLFRKRETAKHRLKRDPTWEEVVFEYKGILKQDHPKAIRIKNDFKELYKELNGSY